MRPPASRKCGRFSRAGRDPRDFLEPAGRGDEGQHPAGPRGRRVRPHRPCALRETPLFARARAVVAFASVAILLFAGLVLEHPAPGTPKYEGVVVQTTANGIQVREGGQALRLLHSGAQNVQVSVGAQGSMRARYVDPETGYVTINNVYAD